MESDAERVSGLGFSLMLRSKHDPSTLQPASKSVSPQGGLQVSPAIFCARMGRLIV